jgi:hypothetical protein
MISLTLCLSYLLLLPITPFGMAALIFIGSLVTTSLGRRDEIGLTAITTAVVMIVAASDSQNAWQQPLLRLVERSLESRSVSYVNGLLLLCFTGSSGKKCADVRFGSRVDGALARTF